jgi:hypothetical protein
LAQRGSRKRRKRRPRPPREQGAAEGGRGYARSREKDEAARAALRPLSEGERPTAVTVAAVVAGVLAVANLVALVVGYDPDEPRKTVASAVGAGLLALVSWGMWRARYWAVLGMQTILALALVGALVALFTAVNAAAVVLIVAIIVPAGTLFWFLIKAMARIQMPERPGRGV